MLQYVLKNLSVCLVFHKKKNYILSVKLIKKCQWEEFTDLNRKTPIA